MVVHLVDALQMTLHVPFLTEFHVAFLTFEWPLSIVALVMTKNLPALVEKLATPIELALEHAVLPGRFPVDLCLDSEFIFGYILDVLESILVIHNHAIAKSIIIFLADLLGVILCQTSYALCNAQFQCSIARTFKVSFLYFILGLEIPDLLLKLYYGRPDIICDLVCLGKPDFFLFVI